MSDPTAILEIIVGIVVTLTCVAAVPFAIRVTSELARMNAKLDAMAWQDAAINELRAKVHELDVRLATLLQPKQ